FFPQHHFRFGGTCWWIDGCKALLEPRRKAILEQCLAGFSVSGRLHGVAETDAFRLHYFNHWLFLRNYGSRRQPGGGPRYDPSRGCSICLDSRDRFLCDQDFDFSTLLSLACRRRPYPPTAFPLLGKRHHPRRSCLKTCTSPLATTKF